MHKGNLKPTLVHFKYVLNFRRIPTTIVTNNPCKGGEEGRPLLKCINQTPGEVFISMRRHSTEDSKHT